MPVTITHAKSNIIADWTGTVTVGNSSGGTNTVAATDLVRPQDWNSAHAITLNLTGSEIASLFNIGNGISSTTNASGISMGIMLDDYLEPVRFQNSSVTVSTAPGLHTWYFQQFDAKHGMDKGRINFLLSYNSANFSHGVVGSATNTGQVSRTAAIRHMFGIYTRGTGANSTRVESYWTGEAGVSATNTMAYSTVGATSNCAVSNGITYAFISQIDSAGGYTTTSFGSSGTVSVAATSIASTAVNSLIVGASVNDWFTGSVMMAVPFNTTVPPGDCWLAHAVRTESGTSTTGGGNYAAGTMFNATPALWMLGLAQQSAFKRLGFATSANTTSGMVPFQGQFATTSTAPPAFAAGSDIRASSQRLYWNYMNFAMGTTAT